MVLEKSIFIMEEEDLERLRNLLKYIRELMDNLEKAMEED